MAKSGVYRERANSVFKIVCLFYRFENSAILKRLQRCNRKKNLHLKGKTPSVYIKTVACDSVCDDCRRRPVAVGRPQTAGDARDDGCRPRPRTPRRPGGLSSPTTTTWGPVRNLKFAKPTLRNRCSLRKLVCSHTIYRIVFTKMKIRKYCLVHEHMSVAQEIHSRETAFARNLNKNCNLREYL